MPLDEFPSWIDDPDAWDRVQIGDIFLPGICTVLGLETGIDVDIKKTKGKDGATSEDNGIDPAEFDIEVHLVDADDWRAWLLVFPKINPRRPGAARQPQEIMHPEPNSLGISQITITKVRAAPPSPRGGKKYVIHVQEFFPAPKPANKAKAKQVKHTDNSIYFGDPQALANHMNQQSGFVPYPPPSDPDSIAANLF
jgi:hypothetical protein